ncbi:MAG: hypothetical protein H0W61_16735 [Bacteroidetes bacterium]|nr:hypothetical protein [Bacteroidota bacterium]
MKLEFTVNKPLPYVFEYLTDMEKFVSVHPIIDKMDALGENNYVVYEKLKLLSIPCTFKYKALITGSVNGDHVNIQAVVMRMIEIEMNFHLKTNGDMTQITEEVSFRTVLPVKPIMQKIFREQHLQLFNNIAKART